MSTDGFAQDGTLPVDGPNLTPGWHVVDVVYTKGFFAVYYDGKEYTSLSSSIIMCWRDKRVESKRRRQRRAARRHAESAEIAKVIDGCTRRCDDRRGERKLVVERWRCCRCCPTCPGAGCPAGSSPR